MNYTTKQFIIFFCLYLLLWCLSLTLRLLILPSLIQVLQEQMVASLTSVLDKINSQQFRISQRLQWAAGANPALNTIVDEFERAMIRRKQILQVKNMVFAWLHEV